MAERCSKCRRLIANARRVGDAGFCSADRVEAETPSAFWYRRDCETAAAQYARGQAHGRRSVAAIVERMLDAREADASIYRVVRSIIRDAGEKAASAPRIAASNDEVIRG